MKPLAYYTTYSQPYPTKEDFGRVFVYKAGKIVYEGDLSSWPTVKDNYKSGYTIEKINDREAYLAAREAYSAERKRLRDEFKADLFEDNGVTDNPKAERAYEMALEYADSNNLGDIQLIFQDLASLIR
jgi:hypothetical protein